MTKTNCQTLEVAVLVVVVEQVDADSVNYLMSTGLYVYFDYFYSSLVKNEMLIDIF